MEPTLAVLPELLTAGLVEPGYEAGPHDHPGDEIVLLEGGPCRIRAGDLALEGPAPGVVLMPRGTLHDQTGSGRTRTWYCTYRHHGRALAGPPRAIPLDPGDPLLAWLPGLVRHHLTPGSSATVAAAQLLAVVERIAELEGAAAARRAWPAPLAAALRHIERHLAEDIDAGALAAAAGVGQGHLRTLFRRHLGRSPQEVHRERRLELAAKLLAGSYLSVGEVAAACGWRDPEYFARRFARRHGMPPRDWRQQRPGSGPAGGGQAPRPGMA